MKIHILIHRQTGRESAPGTLKAYVVTPYLDGNGQQAYQRGPQLLRGKGQIRNMDDAVALADAAVLAEWKLGDAPDIEYIIEDLSTTRHRSTYLHRSRSSIQF